MIGELTDSKRWRHTAQGLVQIKTRYISYFGCTVMDLSVKLKPQAHTAKFVATYDHSRQDIGFRLFWVN